MIMILGDLIRRNAQYYPDKPAFIMDGQSVTFGEYNSQVNRLVSALLRRGFNPPDHISILANNCLEYLDIYGAAEKGGFRIAPVNFRLTPTELIKVIGDARPRVLFVQNRYRSVVDSVRADLPSVELYVIVDGQAVPGWTTLNELLVEGDDQEPQVQISPDDVCYLIFTSGTTGIPRAAMLTHQAQWLDAAIVALEMALTPNDRHLGIMPLYHIGGRALVLGHFFRGCTCVLHDGFDAGRMFRDIETYRLTTTHVVSTMVNMMLNHPETGRHDLSSLRLAWYAAAPMPVEVLKRAMETFGPIFMQGFGQTESGPVVTTLFTFEHETEGPGAARLASCGRAVPGVEVKIIDDQGREVPYGEPGEIMVQSPLLMVGYWEKPEATAAALKNGWLHTGDMGRMDPDGYVYIVDRKKDMIVSGGENIYPREIEEVLYAHPAVLEAAIIGVPDELWGESVMALVVLRPGQAATADELIAFSAERLARYKRPKSVEFRDVLPKSPSGKILKKDLREPYWRGRNRQI